MVLHPTVALQNIACAFYPACVGLACMGEPPARYTSEAGLSCRMPTKDRSCCKESCASCCLRWTSLLSVMICEQHLPYVSGASHTTRLDENVPADQRHSPPHL